MEDVRGWRKASYSGNNGGACIEVANGARMVAVRDSKDKKGPQLEISPETWHSFMSRIQRDR
jgi:hypothetical protein